MIVCFDIGGTAIKGGIAYSADDVRPLARRPSPVNDYDAFVSVLREEIARAEEAPDCIAISIAGVIDPETGRATISNIPCLHGRELVADLEAALKLPVIVANDADCFALAEAGIGAGRGHRVVFGAILGTGVGGGLVIDGALINRDGGFAGEWGHGPIAATLAGDPPVQIPRLSCGCGLTGCLDTIGSARGLEKLHAHLWGEQKTSQDIIAAWDGQDKQAGRTVEVFVDIVASPLAMVINMTGATIVPVGGGLANSKMLIGALDRGVQARCLRKFDRPLVVPAVCRIEPGLIGAALLGLAWSAEHSHGALINR